VYKLLRFADREKKPNLCEVVYQYQLCKHEMEFFFGNNVSTWSEYWQILDRRIRDVYVETYVGAGNTYAYFKANTNAFSTYAYFQSGPKQSDPKRQKGKKKAPAKQVTSGASTDDDGQRSPPYQEFGDSSSAEDDGDDDDDDDGDGDGDGDGGGGDGDDDGGGGGAGIRFTGIHTYIYTHV
jgi:hypothetical protein